MAKVKGEPYEPHPAALFGLLVLVLAVIAAGANLLFWLLQP